MATAPTRPAAFGFGLVTLAAVLATALAPRFGQDPRYHRFADARALGSIPNAADVLSSAAFLVAGGVGLALVLRGGARFVDARERWPWLVLFAGVLLTGAGSAAYHLAPANGTLVWDRLPMTLGFMGLFAALLAERVRVGLGVALLGPLVLAGAASVLYWYASELAGAGDLRPYVLVQAYPLVAIPLLLALGPPRYAGDGRLLVALALYLVAKGAEVWDGEILRATGLLSGHTWKHLIAAAAVGVLARHLRRRHPIGAA